MTAEIAAHEHIFDSEDGFCIFLECGMQRMAYIEELKAQVARLQDQNSIAEYGRLEALRKLEQVVKADTATLQTIKFAEKAIDLREQDEAE